MKIVLEYVAMLNVKGPASGATMDLPDGTTARGLLDCLGITRRHQPVVMVFVNDIKVRPEHRITGGDRIFLAMPVGGG